MLRILERVAGPNFGSRGRGGITRVTPYVAEYWLETTERIMDDLDCTPEQKLKVKESTQPDRLTWEFFKTTFQIKYMGASYIDARRHEFMNLTQGDRYMAEYEAKFLRLSRYSRGMVASEYERCVCFEDSLRDGLKVLIAPQRKREFAVLVEKAKISKDNRDRERGKNKRDSEPSSFVQKPKKKARSDGPVRVGAPVASTGIVPCGDCGRRHLGECWRRIGACLRCGSLEHRIRGCPLRADKVQAPASGSTQP
ncbi:ATP-dependent zinc metalloprotease FtsH [Gossypium australe]|uniref:ATP-dependent zinc metalloprotease FtsH n=1 Tax=Gossypium australe TaxID=47621 RepID=A0A5B6X3M0_9ROSI|nr:ATP-dependent zinc metalloprotease FtsH [Gossypium australe]